MPAAISGRCSAQSMVSPITVAGAVIRPIAGQGSRGGQLFLG
jgi:hypothetical protein